MLDPLKIELKVKRKQWNISNWEKLVEEKYNDELHSTFMNMYLRVCKEKNYFALKIDMWPKNGF